MQQYTPKAILITGGAGFIGSHVATRLAWRYPGYRVVVLDKLDYCASLENLRTVIGRPNFMFVKGDIQSMDLVCHLLQSENIDTVMHFAAQTHVDNSFGNSLEFTMNNTYGTHVLLEACRKHGGIRRFINVSTDEVYGETSLGESKGLAEGSVLDPTNPYSAAKAGAEMLCKAYVTSYRMPIIITRGNNVYGPGQFPEKLVPKFAILASRGAELPLHGDGSAIRSYLYVDDVVDAFECVLHRGAVGEVYNIGTDKERSVASVAADIAAYFGLPASKIVRVRDRAFNDMRYYIGYEKLVALGWSERTTWEEGLKRTIEWYVGVTHARSAAADADVRPYWVGDIEPALRPHPCSVPPPADSTIL